MHRITFLRLINAYLVEEDDGLTLIDCGVRQMAPRIRKAIAELDRPVVRIALTHAHDDHVRVAPALRGEVVAPIMLHPDDRPL